MKLEIHFPVNPGEHSKHLRRNLFDLFVKLGLHPIVDINREEWRHLIINEVSPTEQQVDKIFLA